MTMHELLIILIIAALLTYGVGIVTEHKRGLGFLSMILSTCAVLGIVQSMDELGDLFLVVLVPMLYVMFMSIVHLITKGPDA